MRRPAFCSSVNSTPSPPTTPVDKNPESRLSKVKRMITDSIMMGRRKKESEGEKENSLTPGTATVAVCMRKECTYADALKEIHIEVAASSATEIVLKPRKRKERLDSGGSINQETKVIRSSSEERREVKPDVNVRRVWSHDELKALDKANENTSFDLNLNESRARNEEVEEVEPSEGPGLVYEDLEARRSSERFSRGWCATPRRRKVSRRAPPPDRSPSPVCTKLDLSSLHQQIEGSEPLTSRDKILSPDEEPESPAIEALISPRNSLVMRLEYLDPNLPPSPPQTHLHALRQQDKQERRLMKQIHTIKRQLKRYEQGFLVEFGYRPSQADKMANKDIKRLMSDLSKFRLQLKELKEDDTEEISRSECSGGDKAIPGILRATSPIRYSKSNKTMEETLQDMEKRLQEKREACGRSAEISELTSDQLVEEKLAVQKALLTLENTFGRPVAQMDRDLVRPLYQRYRALKRLVVRTTTGKLNSSASELATILEHEAMEFSPAISLDVAEEPLGVEIGQGEAQDETVEEAGPSSSSSDSVAENLHALPLSQLLEQQKRLKEEKKNFRRSLREFDEKFLTETGRRAQKQDRLVVETIYVGYKQSKAKLRLLDALIAKKSQVKRNSC